jgi:hypothetical protein
VGAGDAIVVAIESSMGAGVGDGIKTERTIFFFITSDRWVIIRPKSR